MKKIISVVLGSLSVVAISTSPVFGGNKQAINGTDGTFNSGNTWTGDFGKTRNSNWPREYIEVLDRGSSMAFTISDRNGNVKVCNTTNSGFMDLGRGINSDGNSKLTVTVLAGGGECFTVESTKSSVLELSVQ